MTDGITGRDDFIIATALHEAIKMLEKLPDSERPESDIEDMRAILNGRYSEHIYALAFRDDVVRAMRLGMELRKDRPVLHSEILAFLQENKPKPV